MTRLFCHHCRSRFVQEQLPLFDCGDNGCIVTVICLECLEQSDICLPADRERPAEAI